MLHSYVTDMAARVTPTIQIPLFLVITSLHLWSYTLADPAVGFGGGQLGEVTQARVPPKLKTPRI